MLVMNELSTHDLIDAALEVFEATIELGRQLDQSDADRPTGCPGWSLQDQFAHIVGLEQVLAGAPEPDIDLPSFDHVNSDFDAFMEAPIHIRRPLPLCAVVDELAGMAPRRVAQLRALADQGDPEIRAPFGTRRLSVALPVRVFDLWAHEQDIRRAVGVEPRVTGLSAELSMERSLLGWRLGLDKAVKGANGVLTIELIGSEPSTTAITLGDGGSEAALRGDLGQLTSVFCGRGEFDDSLLTGDATLIAALRDHLSLTP